MPGRMSLGENTNEDATPNEARGSDVNSVAPGMLLAPVQTQLRQNSLCNFPVTPIQTLCPLETLGPSRLSVESTRGQKPVFCFTSHCTDYGVCSN